VFAACTVAVGIGFLVAAARAALDARAFASAPRCSVPVDGACVAEADALLVDAGSESRTKQRTYYYVDVRARGGRTQRLELVSRQGLEAVQAAHRIRLRMYRGRTIAVVAGTREVETIDHPRFAWSAHLAFGFGALVLGSYMLYFFAAIARRARDSAHDDEVGSGWPLFIGGAGAPIVASTIFEVSSSTLAWLTAACAALVIVGAAWIAVRARPTARA
jgi:hypothetical protein